MKIDHRKEFLLKLTFRASIVLSLWQRANARNVGFRTSLTVANWHNNQLFCSNPPSPPLPSPPLPPNDTAPQFLLKLSLLKSRHWTYPTHQSCPEEAPPEKLAKHPQTPTALIVAVRFPLPKQSWCRLRKQATFFSLHISHTWLYANFARWQRRFQHLPSKPSKVHETSTECFWLTKMKSLENTHKAAETVSSTKLSHEMVKFLIKPKK